MTDVRKSYLDFLESKKHSISNSGFETLWTPDIAFDFQKHIIDKVLFKGRMAIYADTGLGKTLMQLTIAHNIVMKTNGRVLILAPLAVSFQFIKEAEFIGVPDIEVTKDGNFTKKIIICNYERLHYLDPNDFEAVICDESSILKNFDGKIKQKVTSFVKKCKYRILSTATPAPNDYIEFGTSSEALGYLGYMDMIARYFGNKEKNFKPTDIGSKFYLKPHAKNNFFNWVNSWSVTIKMPSDLGFSDDGYVLPKLTVNDHTVKNDQNWNVNGQAMLFNRQAKRLSEVREEQKQTIEKRCNKAVELADGKTSVYWCNFNAEGDLLAKLDKHAVQVKGGMSIDKKEDILIDFAKGNIERLITKPKISSMGLNWQHCNHSVFFPTFSFEQQYQAFRRFWRFGQENEVTIDRVISDGQIRVIQALQEKEKKAIEFQQLIKQSLKDNKLREWKEFDEDVIKPKFL